MALTEEETKAVLLFVKREPRTVQEISKLIKRSWVTTDSYLKQIKERTGLLDIKIFRGGTQAALKLVYYTSGDSLLSDDAREKLFLQIKQGRRKQDFDFLDLFQYVQEGKKKIISESYTDPLISKSQKIAELFRSATGTVYCFSGNLSFLNMQEGKVKMPDLLEELLKNKVNFKILARINVASLENVEKLSLLMQKYPGQIEIKHCYQPLRGFIVDEKMARFKHEEESDMYKEGELHENTRIFYEIYDQEWVNWLQKIFWNLYRGSIDHSLRIREMGKLRFK